MNGYNYNNGRPNYYGMPQAQMPNYMQPQYQQQAQTAPNLQGVQFATFDEVKAYIVPANSKLMFMDTNEAKFYIKTADSIGVSTVDAFEFKKIETQKPEQKTNNIVLDEYVKKDDLKQFATSEQFENIMKEIEAIKGGAENGKPLI